ncbi:PREDICTED: uncharacterized protein LOC105558643 isoform X2 [Vollenhovia emeryi]|nr:PREDICTED: uncharacterized protein LOC105558643 isoform X2 [Vollenhovia emeryi]
MSRTFYSWLLTSLVVHAYATPQKFIEVHDLNSKELSPVDQLAPINPALHTFPTIPTVPLLPNCAKQGYLRDPFNCGKFYRCEHSRGVPVAYYCQPGTIFNTLTESCDHPQYVQC